MRRPPFLGIMGPPKEGKTIFALSAVYNTQTWQSEPGLIDPTRWIHFDNHGSTDPYPVHQYTTAEPWGVRHIPADDPNKLLSYLKDIRRQARTRPPYDLITVDDWSEYSQADIEDKMDENPEEGKAMRNWRDHGDVMREAARVIHPVVSKASVLCLFQAAQLPNPLEEKPKKVENKVLKYTADTRDTMIRPFLQGAFAAWLPYKLDALLYQYMIITGGKYKFQLQLVKDTKVDVLTRWLRPWVEDPRRDKNLTSPTWAKLMAFIQTQTKNEEV